MELRLSSCFGAKSNKVTENLHWWPDGFKTSTSNIKNGGKLGNRGAWNAHLDVCRQTGLSLWDTGLGCSRTKDK